VSVLHFCIIIYPVMRRKSCCFTIVHVITPLCMVGTCWGIISVCCIYRCHSCHVYQNYSNFPSWTTHVSHSQPPYCILYLYSNTCRPVWLHSLGVPVVLFVTHIYNSTLNDVSFL